MHRWLLISFSSRTARRLGCTWRFKDPAFSTLDAISLRAGLCTAMNGHRKMRRLRFLRDIFEFLYYFYLLSRLKFPRSLVCYRGTFFFFFNHTLISRLSSGKGEHCMIRTGWFEILKGWLWSALETVYAMRRVPRN
ncbi:hypothetical protein MPH_05010 [Macrophomina phaseolina MS6]|uniref:Uncharacterized protein n=1 Tax=Macrophomina phaseolina (strain MS6) TaxID=1126212 RepID=K2R5T9_MACPH|nr:hypothetical protein MPH_05010 [Macrophomina phaseolina MS6]